MAMKRLVLLAVVALGAAAGALVWLVRASLPDEPSMVSTDAIGAPVSIRYDWRARPFVTAESLPDALFAQGWLHGRERLWQMELMRRAGSGTMAEALGEDLLETDRELWRAGVPQLAASLERNASLRLRRRIETFVRGINTAMAGYRVWPPEFLLTRIEPRPWRPQDVYAIGALVAFQSANNLTNELLRMELAGVLDRERFGAFLPDESTVPDFPYVIDVEPTAALSSLDSRMFPSAALGSNGWVVSPARSASGRALFAFDSHDDLALPNLFYEVHLFFGEGEQIRGWSVAGLPGVINGYNRYLAWGLTNIGDTQDVFVEERHPEDPLQFLGPDGWYRAQVSRVEIAVAGREAPEVLEIVRTRHGPLIQEDPPLALRWTGHDVGSLGLDGFFDVNLARDHGELLAALDRVPVPSANVTWADVAGNIGFRTMGLLPVRMSGAGLVPRSGVAADAGWRGFIASSELPSVMNPPSGYVAAANARVTAQGPLVSADNAPGYRMRRLRQRLGGRDELSPADMQRLQLDWYNAQADLLLPSLLPALEGQSLSGLEGEALATLREWSRAPVNEAGSAGALIYEHFYVALAREVFAPVLAPELLTRLERNNYVLNHALDHILQSDAGSPWWHGERNGRIVGAFQRAVRTAAAVLGKSPRQWEWQSVQHVEMRHELADVPVAGRWLSRGPYPWAGGPATVGRARYRYHQPFAARAGATVRVVAEMGDIVRAWAIMPGGQSGHPASPAYADQIPAWLAGELDAIAPAPDPAWPRSVLFEPAR